MEILSFSRFEIQFGEDPNSQLNKTLQECLVSFNLSHIVFKIGIIDKKLQPFEALSNLIKVKKINLYLNVKDAEGDVVSSFKIEDCNFTEIVNAHKFLNGFTREPYIKSDYESVTLKVAIDIESVSIHEIVLWKKENKSLKAIQSIDAKDAWPSVNEIMEVKKKGSPFHDAFDHIEKLQKRVVSERENEYVEYAKQANYEESSLEDFLNSKAYEDSAVVGGHVAVGTMNRVTGEVMGGREI